MSKTLPFVGYTIHEGRYLASSFCIALFLTKVDLVAVLFSDFFSSSPSSAGVGVLPRFLVVSYFFSLLRE